MDGAYAVSMLFRLEDGFRGLGGWLGDDGCLEVLLDLGSDAWFHFGCGQWSILLQCLA